MAMNNKGLGRGIQALFDGSTSEAVVESPLRNAAVEAIGPNPVQPREVFDEDALQSLAESIRHHGIVEPLVVRPGQAGHTYQLIAGERRLRAAKLAGLAEVPVIVREVSDQEARILTLLENLQRVDLNPIEEARSMDALRTEANLTLEQLADTLGRPRSSVSNSLRLLGLAPEIQQSLAEKQLTPGHAKLLGGLADEQAALALSRRIVASDLTVRETSEAIAFWNKNGHFPWDSMEKPLPEKKEPDEAECTLKRRLADITEQLHNEFECEVKVRGNLEKGKITLSYASHDQLQSLLARVDIGYY